MNNSGQIYTKKSKGAIAQSGYAEGEALTMNQVTSKLNVCRNTVYKLIQERKLTRYNLGRAVRFNRAEVESLINKSQNENQDVARADS